MRYTRFVHVDLGKLEGEVHRLRQHNLTVLDLEALQAGEVLQRLGFDRDRERLGVAKRAVALGATVGIEARGQVEFTPSQQIVE
jgi:hypothetical protein